GRPRGAWRAPRLRPWRAQLRCWPWVAQGRERQPSDTRRPLVRLALSPGSPADVRAPALGIPAVPALLLGRLGCALEGSLQWPDCVGAMGRREAIGPPT